jgi:peptide/nickel transport system substrate-binding protein
MRGKRILAALCLALSPTLASAETSGSFTVAFGAEGTVLDPTKYSAGVDHYFIGQMFEQLVRSDPDQKPVNWLAESWELQQMDGKPVIDVKLRPASSSTTATR